MHVTLSRNLRRRYGHSVDFAPPITVGALAVVFIAALVARLAFAAAFGGSQLEARFSGATGDPESYDWMAKNILEHGNIGYRGEPSARRPPGYPLFLAGVYSIFGPNYAIVRVIQSAIDAASATLVCAALLLLGARRAGVFSGLAYALYPHFVFNASEIMTEVLVLFFTTLTIFLLTAAFVRRGGWLAFVAAGLSCGGLFLVRENNILLVAPLALFTIVALRHVTVPARVALATAFVLGFAVIYAPYSLRNYRLFGQFVLTGTAGAENLVRNMGEAVYRDSWDFQGFVYENDLMPFWEFHDPANAGKRFPDELVADKKSFEIGTGMMREHPGAFVSYGVQKLGTLLVDREMPGATSTAPLLRLAISWAYLGVAISGVAGLVIAWRRGHGRFVLLLAIFAGASLFILFIVPAWKRYRFVGWDLACIYGVGIAVVHALHALSHPAAPRSLEPEALPAGTSMADLHAIRDSRRMDLRQRTDSRVPGTRP